MSIEAQYNLDISDEHRRLLEKRLEHLGAISPLNEAQQEVYNHITFELFSIQVVLDGMSRQCGSRRYYAA